MFLYEIRKKGEGTRYLVVAENTQKARNAVIRLFSRKYDIDITQIDLEAKYADEEDARQRIVSSKNIMGFKYQETAWDLYQQHKGKDKTKIIAHYLY